MQVASALSNDLAIPMTLCEAGLPTALNCCFNLFKGFYVSRPADERGKMRHIYISSRRNQEVESNRELHEKLQSAGQRFLKLAERLSYDPKNSEEFEARESRYLYQEEKQLMHQNLGKGSAIGVKARTTIDRYCNDKWLQLYLNANRHEVEKLIPIEQYCTPTDRELYQQTQRKLQKFPEGILYPLDTPGLFASAELKEQYLEVIRRKQQIVKERFEVEKALITGEGDDFPIIHSNLGLGGLGSSRSPYGAFTAEAILYLKTVAQSILKVHQLTEGQLRAAKMKLEAICSEDRLLLLLNTFVEVYGRFQMLRYGSLEKIRCKASEKMESPKVEDPQTQKVDEKVREVLLRIKSDSDTRLKSPRQVTTTPLKADEVAQMATLVEVFFQEALQAHTGLDDFLVLLEVRLEKDFTAAEKEQVENVQKPRSHERARPKDGSIILQPNALDKLLNNGATRSNSLGSLEQTIKVQDYNLLKGYLEIFQIPLQLLDLVVKARTA